MTGHVDDFCAAEIAPEPGAEGWAPAARAGVQFPTFGLDFLLMPERAF